MSRALLINENELAALEGQPYMLYALYLYLRRFMDYGTGIVGFRRGISYQSIAEALYLEPEPGMKSGSPSKWVIQRALKRLERIGMLERTGGMDNLVFRMTLAQTDKSARKQAATNPLSHPAPVEPAPVKVKRTQAAPTQNTQAATPPVSGKPSHIATTTTTNTGADCSSSNSLIFPKHTDEASRESMQKMLQGIEPADQQELLDELQGYISKGKVQSTPTALLHGMVQRFKVGAFNPAYAPKVKSERERAAIKAAEPPKLVTVASKEKGRQRMAQVKELFNKKKGGVHA